jgi:hypothetical protein
VFVCTVGELIGFGGIPVCGGAMAFWLTSGLVGSSRSLILYAVAVAGGLGEGAVLAWFQLRVLRDHIPSLNARHWVLATAAAASFAWACGMLAPTLDDIVGISGMIQIGIWIPASLLILLSIGAAQAWVLRDVVDNPLSWVVANSLGWLAGLPWTFVLPALLPESAPIALWVSTFVIAGILMGLTVGLVTGVALLRLRPIRISATEVGIDPNSRRTIGDTANRDMH